MSVHSINMATALAARDSRITADEGRSMATAAGEYVDGAEKKAFKAILEGLKANRPYVEFKDTYGETVRAELTHVDPQAIEAVEAAKKGGGMFAKMRAVIGKAARGFRDGAGTGFVVGSLATLGATVAGVFPPSAPAVVTVIGLCAGGTAVYKAVTENRKD